MFKKILCVFAVLGVIAYIYAQNALSELASLEGEKTYYVGVAASNAYILNEKDAGVFLDKVKGESCRVNDMGVETIMKEYKAAEVFVEEAEGTTSYYCFSPLLKRSVIIKGREINLHIAVKNDEVTVGTPLIFGSF